MPNKVSEGKVIEPKMVSSPGQTGPRVGGNTAKNSVSSGKTVKETAMSPTGVSSEPERTELLGSLTTQQQQRTSARVIKKLRLEPDKDKRKTSYGADDIPECDTPNKIEEKDLKFPTVKQRMPKALWSTDEKSLFFEALNEYGKDFDAITAYICAKMKKKGMTDSNLKTKTQVSHFYYRTWHKLSKHVHFGENVKKVAQELYALINYGELRKKLVSVSEKTCSRLSEMVRCGSMVVRARGRNLRVRTPMCAALRRLNMITERGCGARVCSRAQVVLRARTVSAWARVQSAAHNPRAAAALPLRAPLAAFIRALEKRWQGLTTQTKHEADKFDDDVDDDDKDDLRDHLQFETDIMITQGKKLSLHVGPRPEAEIHIPTITECEQLSSQKICFSSYLERICSQHSEKGGVAKLRTTKRQRKDSTTEKDTKHEIETKKLKLEENDPVKLINIDETAIDGIELMASYKNNLDDDEKPSTEDEKDVKSEETAEDDIAPENVQDKDVTEKEIVDKDVTERDKDSFSEMEDDEKFNKSDTDNESDHNKEKSSKGTKFKNLKVKFRIRPKKRGRSEYTMVIEKEQEPKIDEVKVGEVKVEDSKEDEKPDVDLDLAIRQVRKGWSALDAGDLTIGDLYLMFGSRSKLELDYWWAESTPPIPPKVPSVEKDRQIDKKEKATDKTPDKDTCTEEGDRARETDTELFSPKNVFGQDSNDGLSGDERKSEQQASPEHKTSTSNCSGTFKLVSKLVNRPTALPQNNSGFSLLSDRLKRLLSLAGNPHLPVPPPRCRCGHVCAADKKHQQGMPKPSACVSVCVGGGGGGGGGAEGGRAPVFRHPAPIAPRPDTEQPVSGLSLEGLPRWRRGRPRAHRRVVVQRLLPLLPKLPSSTSVIPVRAVPHSPPPPRILPKPPPTSTSDLSFFYVLSESNGQFFFHDGDRRIPITPLLDKNEDESDSQGQEDEIKDEDEEPIVDIKEGSSEVLSMAALGEAPADTDGLRPEQSTTDIANFLPSESMSLSPSRLLRDSEWLEGAVQDFSLSSFLGHLESRPQPDGAVDSQLHSLMAESSVDYVAKFADLAAEVTDGVNPLPTDDLP